MIPFILDNIVVRFIITYFAIDYKSQFVNYTGFYSAGRRLIFNGWCGKRDGVIFFAEAVIMIR